MQKYRVYPDYSDGSHKRYPLYITSVGYISQKTAQCPDGRLFVQGIDQNGKFSRSFKCFIAKRTGQRYCRFGTFRLFAGYTGPVHLVAVPTEDKEKISALAVKYGSIVE